MKIVNRFISATVLLLGATIPLSASWVLIEDFSSGTGNWTTLSGATITDSSGAGLFTAIGSSGFSGVFLGLGSNAILDGNMGTIFFRFQYNSTVNGAGYGPTAATPSTWNDQGNYLFADGSDQINTRTNTATEVLSQTANASDPFVPATGTWYSAWITIDNTGGGAPQASFYIEPDGTAIASTILYEDGTSTSVFNARSTATGDLANFFIAGNSGSTMLFDDIYVDSTATNLTNPIPEPSAIFWVTGALALMAWRVRGGSFSR